MLKKFLLTLIFVFCAAFLSSSSAFAEGVNIEISPVSNYFTIKSGDVQKYKFTIKNKGESAFSFKLYTAPYIVTDEEYSLNFDESNATSYNQITRWVTFKDESGSYVSNPVFSIEGGAEKEIEYRIKVPDSIPDGGQYGIIFAETIDNSKEGGISAVSRVALSLIGHGLGSTENSAEISDYYVTHPFTSEGITAGAKVKNSGNTDFEAIYHLTVNSIFGKKLYDNSTSYTILPETERRVAIAWENAPIFGVFSVHFLVSAADSIKEETHLVFIMPIFVIVIMLLLLTMLVIWIIILIRKRKERSSRLVV